MPNNFPTKTTAIGVAFLAAATVATPAVAFDPACLASRLIGSKLGVGGSYINRGIGILQQQLMTPSRQSQPSHRGRRHQSSAEPAFPTLSATASAQFLQVLRA